VYLVERRKSHLFGSLLKPLICFSRSVLDVLPSRPAGFNHIEHNYDCFVRFQLWLCHVSAILTILLGSFYNLSATSNEYTYTCQYFSSTLLHSKKEGNHFKAYHPKHFLVKLQHSTTKQIALHIMIDQNLLGKERFH